MEYVGKAVFSRAVSFREYSLQEKRYSLCHKTTPPNLRRRLSASVRKKDEPTKASLQGMVYLKPASPSDAENLVRKAK